MITREKVRDWLGAHARCCEGRNLGLVDAIYVPDADEPEFAAVRSSGTEPRVVPLARAKGQDGVLQLAYAWDQVQDVPVVGTSEKLSQEDLASLYAYYGLENRVAATDQHTVQLHRRVGNDNDPVGSVEEPYDIHVRANPIARSAPIKATQSPPREDDEDFDDRTVDDLRQLAAERGVTGCGQMDRDTLISALGSHTGRIVRPEERESETVGARGGGVRFQERAEEDETVAAATGGARLENRAEEEAIPARTGGTRYDNRTEEEAIPATTGGTAYQDRIEEEDSGLPAGATRFEDRTVEELQQLAAERGIQGRSQMLKAELLTALYEDHTLEELQQLAAQWGIQGRSQMTKDDLVAAFSEQSGASRGRRSDGEDPAQEQTGAAASRTRYEDRTVEELQQLAAERGIQGRSQMDKEYLITALRCYR